ncbi:hypothetical protein HpBGD76_14640 [Helicobacter pylori]|uniref:hypothetical protein n=1 Tax=Helicobacter pylori TaxID=210 RepID=UPI0036F2770C
MSGMYRRDRYQYDHPTYVLLRAREFLAYNGMMYGGMGMYGPGFGMMMMDDVEWL